MTILWFLAGALASAVVAWLTGRGRSEELRTAVSDARSREIDATAKAAAGAAEMRVLDCEKTKALKDAEAANKRADEIVVSEREKAAAILHAKDEQTAAVLRAKDEQIDKLNDFITQARSVLTAEFKAVSGDVLKDARGQLAQAADELIKKHGEKSAVDVELHRQEIETMLKPVEATMKRLDEHVETSNRERSNAETLLNDQIERLAGASESLSSALRKPVIRGSWGEMTLENALENAGLRAEVDFVLQHSTDGEDGRKRTDAIINLPKGRKLIIDSKNLMESYIAYSIAQDPAQKTLLQAAHARCLKSHIRDLSSKAYQERYDSPDCVILFIPHDGMYHAALQDEAELIREACEKRVFVTNPMSLIPLLKAVGYVLNQERANKSAEAIKHVGQDLYAQIVRFASNMACIGTRLEASVKAYNDAIPGLDRYILSKARTLKQLGAGRGAEPELPELVELEPRPFSSRELKTSNLFLQEMEEESELSLAASSEGSEER